MDDIETRALQFFAAEYMKEGRMMAAKKTMEGNDLQAHAQYIAIRAIIAALSAAPSDSSNWVRLLLDIQPFAHRNDASRLWQLLDDEQACATFVAEAERLASALAPQGVPDGWVLVPAVATPQMVRAGAGEVLISRLEASNVWAAMIAAKPGTQA